MGKRSRTVARAGNAARRTPSDAKSRRDAQEYVSIDHLPKMFFEHDRRVRPVWASFPPGAEDAILKSSESEHGTMTSSLRTLIKFWSDPKNVGCARGGEAGSFCVDAWWLALEYLKMDLNMDKEMERPSTGKEARALLANGSFLHQCYNSSIEHIQKILRLRESVNNPEKQFFSKHLPFFARGFDAIQSPARMEKHIRGYLPKERSIDVMSRKAKLRCLDGTPSKCFDPKQFKFEPMARPFYPHGSKGVGEEIKITLVDDAKDYKRHVFHISSSSPLKDLFNDYAARRGVSLRSFRFSYAGRTLFFSITGHKTLGELGMEDGHIIQVHDSSGARELNGDDSSGRARSSKSSTPAKKAKKKNGRKKAGGKRRKRPQNWGTPPETSPEMLRIRHSELLTKIHDEAGPRFKLIRQHLNNLAMERSGPKARPRPCDGAPELAPCPPPETGHDVSEKDLEGKGGRSHFYVHAGEVQNLYRTVKPSLAAAAPSPSSRMPALDLHGRSREEALQKLDEGLGIWIDEAMRGRHPFVRSAVIVCGCGSQVLRETVERWIARTDGVANAPGSRRRPRRQ